MENVKKQRVFSEAERFFWSVRTSLGTEAAQLLRSLISEIKAAAGDDDVKRGHFNQVYGFLIRHSEKLWRDFVMLYVSFGVEKARLQELMPEGSLMFLDSIQFPPEEEEEQVDDVLATEDSSTAPQHPPITRFNSYNSSMTLSHAVAESPDKRNDYQHVNNSNHHSHLVSKGTGSPLLRKVRTMRLFQDLGNAAEPQDAQPQEAADDAEGQQRRDDRARFERLKKRLKLI